MEKCKKNFITKFIQGVDFGLIESLAKTKTLLIPSQEWNEIPVNN